MSAPQVQCGGNSSGLGAKPVGCVPTRRRCDKVESGGLGVAGIDWTQSGCHVQRVRHEDQPQYPNVNTAVHTRTNVAIRLRRNGQDALASGNGSFSRSGVEAILGFLCGSVLPRFDSSRPFSGPMNRTPIFYGTQILALESN